MGDFHHVQRVLLNLLSNAVKFTENGVITVSVSTVHGGLRFAVTDSGIGIAPEARDRLFRAFSQVDSSISRRFGGTGLGLAICKRIVEALGGRIGVESAVGVGSEFWFEIPMQPAAPVVVPEAETGSQAPLPALRVLVVEDMAVNRQVAAKFLARLGQQVALAEDGEQGVAAAACEAFDVILMDMQMPVMDGIAAARAIRASGNAVPIIAMTANASDSDRGQCMAAGMNGFYAKPITLHGLAAALRPFAGDVAAGRDVAPAPPAQDQPDDGMWNRARVDELVAAVGEDGFSDLVAMFEADLPDILAGLGAAVVTADSQNYDRALHALKGAAASVGLSRLAALAETYRHGPVSIEAVQRISEDAAQIGAAPLKRAA
jgi:CheY-like chemotaxis protein